MKRKTIVWVLNSILILTIFAFLYTTALKFNYIYFHERHYRAESIDEILLLCDAYGVTYSDNISVVEYIDTNDMRLHDGMLKLSIKDIDVFFSENANCYIFETSFTDGAQHENEINYSNIIVDSSHRNSFDDGTTVYGTSYCVRIYSDDGVGREGNIIFSNDDNGNLMICFYVNINSLKICRYLSDIREEHYYDDFSLILE